MQQKSFENRNTHTGQMIQFDLVLMESNGVAMVTNRSTNETQAITLTVPQLQIVHQMLTTFLAEYSRKLVTCE